MRKTRFYKRYHPKTKRKSIFKNRFFWISCLIVLLLGFFFYFLFFSSFFQIEKIIISGNKSVSEKEIENIVKENLRKKNLFFSTQSTFLINLSNIKKEILKTFPQIAEVEISRGFPDSLNIIVIERVGVANFCLNEKCFLIDSEGVIFENQKENFLKIEEKRKNLSPLNFGQKVIEKENLEKILEIERYINEKFEFGIEKILLFEEKITVLTKEGWKIFLDFEKELNWQLTKLDLVLKEKIPPEKRRNLEYIELRFGDLATFKYR